MTMPAIGDSVVYRSLAGPEHDAIVTGTIGDRFVDLDVIVPGRAGPVHLTGVRYNSEPAAWARAWPRAGAGSSKPETGSSGAPQAKASHGRPAGE